LVVTPDPRVAEWAREPIEIGPGHHLRPIVIGPDAVPRTDESEAQRHPELAVLSALVHTNDESGVQVALAAFRALEQLDDEHSILYYDLIVERLPRRWRTELDGMRLGGKEYEYQSEFARKYFGEGKEKGIEEGREDEVRRALLEVLDVRGLLTEDARTHIGAQRDLARLRSWLRQAVTAQSVDQVFAT
jgi:hypothetical protein